jgi:hypothetical protein
MYLTEHTGESGGQICKQIKEIYNDIERQNLFSNMEEKLLLIFYCYIILLEKRL